MSGQTVYRLFAHLSEESTEDLDVWFRESPYALNVGPVEIFASFDPIEADIDEQVFFVAYASGLKIGWDPRRGTSPAIVTFTGQDFRVFRELTAESHRPALPHDFQPVMVVSPDVVRRRNYVTYINSVDDALHRNPVQLRFNSWSVAVDTQGVLPQILTTAQINPLGLSL